MCCEQDECALVVFNEVEAVCYLKSSDALAATLVEATGVSTYTITAREGTAEPVELLPTQCSSKRGVAFGFQESEDLYTLKDGISWWYDWSPGSLADGIFDASLSQGLLYTPMIWGEGDLTEERLRDLSWVGDSSPYLLGFNEPNYGGQANLTPERAAELWPQVRQQAEDLGMELVSPAVNYCYGDCVEQDPVQWLDDFFAACGDVLKGDYCGIKYIAIHSYACEVKYLNKHIHMYSKYNMPIWLTEFACGFHATEFTAEGQASAQYLKSALTYLELHPNIYRYAWFTAISSDNDGIDNSINLLDAETKELTAVGKVSYAELCPRLDVDPLAAVIVNAVITNVGGAGYYDDVVDMIGGENMQCPSFDDACVKEEVCVSGDLAPFDEVSVAFRGPLNLYNIAWYEGTAERTLERTTTWTPGELGENIAFMNNRGAVGDCAGVWSICGGNGQSFSDETGTFCASETTAFNGNLPNDNEVNIMTGWECASQEQCGFFRDVGMRGWTGGEDGTKVMMFELDMPHCEEEDCKWNRPAVWALNARVMRTAQYGCNCRGRGGNGGCGEFDILEGIVGNKYSDMLFTQVYDFKGASSPGTAKYFERPSEKTTYAAIFRGGDDSYLQVAQLDGWDFTAESLTPSQLDDMKGSQEETHAIYSVDSRSAYKGCKPTAGPTAVDSTDLKLVKGYEYIGCFHDKEPMSERDMALTSKKKFPKNTPQMCATRCAKVDGATFFGLQNGGLVSSVYVLPVEHTYVGCFDDKKGDRDLLLVPKAVSSHLTPAVCAAFCSSVDGATYIGVQAGHKCYCGDSFGKHGESKLCAQPCYGDEDQVCGARNVNSVYTFLPAEEVDLSPFDKNLEDEGQICAGESCGCFLNESLGEESLLRGGSKVDSKSLSRASCKEACAKDDFPFYGLEWSILCYCGGKHTTKAKFLEGIQEYQLAEATEACSMPCPAGDDPEDTCGGPGTIEVWEV
ncbi:unnamed protein product [Pylaiella littoralis]